MNVHRFVLAALAALAALAGCAAQTPEPPRTCYHRNEAVETQIGYCQAVRAGGALHVSGTAGQGEMGAAVRSVYEWLQQTLQANGLSFADVVKETVYTTDLDAFIRSKDVRAAYYRERLPAATWVQVQRLYLPSLVVEIELTAQYPH